MLPASVRDENEPLLSSAYRAITLRNVDPAISKRDIRLAQLRDSPPAPNDTVSTPPFIRSARPFLLAQRCWTTIDPWLPVSIAKSPARPSTVALTSGMASEN